MDPKLVAAAAALAALAIAALNGGFPWGP
jgi:hypothetical protein